MSAKRRILYLSILYFFILLPLLDAHDTRKAKICVIVEKMKDYELGECRFCKSLINAGRVQKDSEVILVNHVKNRLFYHGIIPVDSEESEYCIYVLLYRFEDRKGGDFSVEKPASVGFHMHLLERKNPIRTYNFEEEQKPLLSNILGIGKFIKRRGKWIDAMSLSEEGVKEGVDKLIRGIF